MGPGPIGLDRMAPGWRNRQGIAEPHERNAEPVSRCFFAIILADQFKRVALGEREARFDQPIVVP